jgi:membrane-associated phospholipid phosphatase
MKALPLNRFYWARFVSDLLSPPVVLTLTACLVAGHEAESSAQAALLAGLFILFSVLLPVMILAWWVYRGKVTDMHMPERRERYWPLAVSITGSLLAWLAVRLVDGTPGIYLLTSFMVVENLVALVITFYWQISVHSGIITAAVTILALVYGLSIGLAVSPLILLVAAARLKLKRHTVSQVVAGCAVGMGTVLLLNGLSTLGVR